MTEPRDRAVEARLAALAGRLDEASPPLTAADVVTRRVRPAPRRWHPLLAAGGAALAVAAAVTGFVVIAGDDQPTRVDTADQPAPAPAPAPVAPEPDTPAPATATTGPASPEPGTLPLTLDGTQPPSLLVWDNTEMAVIDYSGKELARAPMGGWYPRRPDLGVYFVNGDTGGAKPQDGVAVDDPIPGCEAVHGRGGLLVAACGGPGGQGESEIRIVGVDGTSRRLTGPRFEIGHWRHALPSPDGRWVLAQWSAECEVPIAYLVDVASGRVEDVAPAGTDSYAIAWAPDGRAVVGIGAGPCSNDGITRTGTFLVDPDRQVRTRIHDFFAGAPVGPHYALSNRLERRVDRARSELGLEGCCGEPSHGSESSSDGMVFEGAEIGIFAVPPALAASLDPVRPSELRFRCGDDTYTLDEFDSNRPDRARLARAADQLVSRLYCARRPA